MGGRLGVESHVMYNETESIVVVAYLWVYQCCIEIQPNMSTDASNPVCSSGHNGPITCVKQLTSNSVNTTAEKFVFFRQG